MNFKKRVNGSWVDTPNYIHNTSTDTITTPADIYANDTTATVGLKGQMEQNGTPTPSSPIQPQECGDLETEGTKAGQYKIPISSASITTPIYLGEVETTRKIKKLVLTGNETWYTSGKYTGAVYAYHSAFPGIKPLTPIFCTHLVDAYESPYVQGTCTNDLNSIGMWIFDTTTSPTSFKAYLADQYAAGTPVTVWYVLATPQTAVVNEPLMRIGDYADEVSGITIPTTAGANTLSVGTTVQPSEVTVNYKGWHPVTDVHERDSGQWD